MEQNLPEAYQLLLARLMAVEREIENIREQLDEIDDELHEVWMGGTD